MMKKTFKITYEMGYKIFNSKHDLYESFFTDFYQFIKTHTHEDFKKYNIKSVADFLSFCANWEADNSHSFYGVGHAFGKYFVSVDVCGKLENQPKTSFIGFLYQNELYTEFIPFLMRFFAYWRTDENYTGSQADPLNTGNDFFADGWASLVDTCKFFHFSSKTLNDTYSWFNSKRVKDALDHIPGVGITSVDVCDIDKWLVLEKVSREGYTFLGWYDSKDPSAHHITKVNKDMTVYAKWQKD